MDEGQNLPFYFSILTLMYEIFTYKCLFVDIFLLCGPELRRYLQNWIMWLMKIFEVLTSRSNPWDESVKYVGLMSQKTYKKCDDGLTHFFGVFGPKMRSIKSVKLNLYKNEFRLSLSHLSILLFCIFTKKSLPYTLLTMPCPSFRLLGPKLRRYHQIVLFHSIGSFACFKILNQIHEIHLWYSLK